MEDACITCNQELPDYEPPVIYPKPAVPSSVWIQCSICGTSAEVTQSRYDELIAEKRQHLCNVCWAKYGEYEDVGS